MQGNFAVCLAEILKLERGWSDNPTDEGAATNLGVTQTTWQHWVGKTRVVTTQDIKHLTVADVTPLYRQAFWNAVHADYLPLGIDLVVFDWAVNSGPRVAIQNLQQALGVSQDGLLGPMTINAATAAPSGPVIDCMAELRRAFYRSLDAFDAFGRGWDARVDQITTLAHTMAQQKTPA